MRNSAKIALTALVSALVLASALSTASARVLSISTSNIRATWRSLEFNSAAATVRCPVTLEGAFHSRTINKVARSLIGAITAAIVNQARCTNGTGSTFNGTERYNGTTAPNTLPWHITYEAFVTALPNITAVIILLARFRFGLNVGGGFGCTAQYGSETDNISGSAAREARGGITAITPVGGRNTATRIRVDNDPFGTCPASGTMTGTSTAVTALNSAALITITLI